MALDAIGICGGAELKLCALRNCPVSPLEIQLRGTENTKRL